MPDFRIVIEMKDVAMGDAEDAAQSVWDEFAEPLDAASGEFAVSIRRVEPSGAQFDTGWEPRE